MADGQPLTRVRKRATLEDIAGALGRSAEDLAEVLRARGLEPPAAAANDAAAAAVAAPFPDDIMDDLVEPTEASLQLATKLEILERKVKYLEEITHEMNGDMYKGVARIVAMPKTRPEDFTRR